MARRSRSGNPKELQKRLIVLLNTFEGKLEDDDLREKVLALVPAVHTLRDLGSSLIPKQLARSARNRIIHYIRQYPLEVVSGDELAIVSGIGDYPRRVRELRVEYGWPIYSGTTAKEILNEELAADIEGIFGPHVSANEIQSMKTDDYILVGEQDRGAEFRWHIANDIRKSGGAAQDRLISYLRQNAGQQVTGEELRYVANGVRDWPRRTRELRTEEGWPVATRSSGRPDLPVGVYVLEADRRSPPHDRQIPDPVRIMVLERDEFKCRCCGWTPSKRQATDPRALLELHHIEHHAKGGSNESDNLISLCNVHHDEVHRQKLNGRTSFKRWLEASC